MVGQVYYVYLATATFSGRTSLLCLVGDGNV